MLHIDSAAEWQHTYFMHCPPCRGTGLDLPEAHQLDQRTLTCSECVGTGVWRDGDIYIADSARELDGESVANAFERPAEVHDASWPLILDYVLDPVRAADVIAWLESREWEREQSRAKRVRDAALTLERLADEMRGTPAHAAIEAAWIATEQLKGAA
jgi:hypothetical protein